MRDSEVKALTRAALVLLLVSGVRALWVGDAGAVGAEPGDAATVDRLMAASESAAAEAAERTRPLAPGEQIDPNTASAQELDRLPGIGPALAERIVAARDDTPFRSASDLTRVPGIGPATLARLGPVLALNTRSRPARAGNSTTVPRVSRSWDPGRMSVEELQRIDGIGPALAKRIVEFRHRNGGIRRLEDLLAVKGIGPATLERMRASLEQMRRPR